MQAKDLLIDAGQLYEQLKDPNLRIVDCRWSLTDADFGLGAFNEAHIPTAQYVPLEPAMSDNPSERGRHPLPRSSFFANVLSNLGVENQSKIVAYDDGSSVYACRFWWMCRWLGHSDVRLLNGGFHKWQTEQLPTTDVTTGYERAEYIPRPSLTREVSAEALQEIDATLIDARTQDRFEGRNETLDHKAGHIPGALCFPFLENLNDSMEFVQSSTRFKGIDPNKDIICYCGSGVSATQNLFALLLAGFPEPILYPGSWSEWIEDPGRPINTGANSSS